jgi:hypothetical protein
MILPQVSLIQLISPFPDCRRSLSRELADNKGGRFSRNPKRWLGFIQPLLLRQQRSEKRWMGGIVARIAVVSGTGRHRITAQDHCTGSLHRITAQDRLRRRVERQAVGFSPWQAWIANLPIKGRDVAV